MRKVSVLSLAAVGMMASIAQGATLYGGDFPDVRLAPGSQAENVFDLNDFFDASAAGNVAYTVDTGGSLNGSMATVFGSQEPGKKSVKFTATLGSESIDRTVDVYVSQLAIGNAPAIDDNNRIAGQEAGNLFLNALTAGETMTSKEPLDLPDVSASPGGSTGGGGTGAAALVVTIASFDLVDDPGMTGLRMRDLDVVAEGTNSASVADQLTATLNEDGSYSLAAGTAIDGDYVVTFGVESGDLVDAVSLVAAEAVPVSLADAAGFVQIVVPTGAAQGSVTAANNAVTVTVGPNAGMLLVSQVAVPVEEVATISADVNAGSANAVIAVLAFDTTGIAALNPLALSYSNPGGTNIQAGVVKNIATTIRPSSGSVLPGIQIFNSGATGDLTVTISSLEVVMAGPLTDYAQNPNAKADMTVEGSISGTTGWQSNIISDQNAAAPTLDPANHFTNPASQGALKLSGTTAANTLQLAQVFTSVALSSGTVVGECYAQRVGDAAAGSNFIVLITDGGANNFASFMTGASIPADSWKLVQCSATLSAAAPQAFFVMQAQNLDVLVDDVSVRVIDDEDALFDAGLLGL